MSNEITRVARLFALHEGELQSLQIAVEQVGALLLNDDAGARLAASHLAIPVHGTIGILLRSIRRNQRTKNQVLDTLRSLPSASTLHLKQAFLDEIVRAVEEVK